MIHRCGTAVWLFAPPRALPWFPLRGSRLELDIAFARQQYQQMSQTSSPSGLTQATLNLLQKHWCTCSDCRVVAMIGSLLSSSGLVPTIVTVATQEFLRVFSSFRFVGAGFDWRSNGTTKGGVISLCDRLYQASFLELSNLKLPWRRRPCERNHVRCFWFEWTAPCIHPS